MFSYKGFAWFLPVVLILLAVLCLFCSPAFSREVLKDPALLKQASPKPQQSPAAPETVKAVHTPEKQPEPSPEKPMATAKPSEDNKAGVEKTPSPSPESSKRPDPGESFLGPVDYSSPGPQTPGEGETENQWQLDPNRGQPKANIPMIIFSLLVVCIIIVAGLKLYSAYIGTEGGLAGAPARKMMVIREKQVLGPNKQLLLVEIPGRTVLLGVTDTDIKVLTEADQEKIDQFQQDAGGEKSAPTPASYLMNVLLRRDSDSGK